MPNLTNSSASFPKQLGYISVVTEHAAMLVVINQQAHKEI